MELWKDIAGYENAYEVSSYGRVRSIVKGRYMKTDKGHPLYEMVMLHKNDEKKRYYVHRLVAQAFIPMIANKPHVNHIDGNHRNNNVKNLEWCTNKENNNHMFDIGANKSAHQVMLKCLTTSKTHTFRSESQASIYLNRYTDYVSKAIRSGRTVVRNKNDEMFEIL